MMSSHKPNWTIGIVNYNTSVYMGWLLKTLYEFNDPHNFKIVLVDNSVPFEKERLEEIIAPYLKFQNIELIFNTPDRELYKEMFGRRSPSGEHGESLSICHDKCDTPFFMAMDPDFFWVKKDILKFFENLFQQGYVAVGIPYFNKIGFGDPDFPGAFGCAYVNEYLQQGDFMPGFWNNEEHVEYLEKYDNDQYVWPFDVGWKIRKRLSPLKKHMSFDQKADDTLLNAIGRQCITCPHQYTYKKEVMGYHLIGGTRHPSQVFGFMDLPPEEQETVYQDWQRVRDNYGRYFYNVLSGKARIIRPSKIKKYVLFARSICVRIVKKCLRILS